MENEMEREVFDRPSSLSTGALTNLSAAITLLHRDCILMPCSIHLLLLTCGLVGGVNWNFGSGVMLKCN